MPKVTWMKQPVNELASVFAKYRRKKRMSSAQVADMIGCTPQNARVQMNKPGKAWNVGQLMLYCDVLGIPYDEAFAAASKK